MNKPSKILDSWLVMQYQEGNKKALAILVKRWHKKFCKQAYWYCKDVDIAKDIAQDSWKTIIVKINWIYDPNKFGSWGLSIVTRKSLDWIRKNKRTNEQLRTLYYTETNSVSEEKEMDKNEKERLKQAIKRLPEQQQIVLQLFYTENYSVHEICEILNCSQGTIKSRLFYAREKLKQLLKI